MTDINVEFYQQKNGPIEKISEIEKIVWGYIRAIGKEDCSEALHYDSRAEINYFLGVDRKSSISWYPFKDNADILEIGGEFGAITGQLCDRARSVMVTEPSLFRAKAIQERYKERQNLKVYAGEFDKMEFPCKFDYIVIMNLTDKIGKYSVKGKNYSTIIEDISKHLKKDGKLLFADENLYNINKCQAVLTPGHNPQKMHRKQIKSILTEAGFEYIQFYYPLPSYQFVGRIYTDDMLPTAVEWNGLANYASADQRHLANYLQLVQNLTDNEMFPFFAPAFFVEASKEDNLSKIEKTSVLFDESFDLPMLGFNWVQKGFKSLSDAINYVKGKKECNYKEEQNKINLLKIDQDYEILEKVRKVELDLLRKLKSVCDKYNLKLYGMYGTLLGTVRDEGIIPGDDDIDVALIRSDYDKLLSLEEEFTGDYFLQTPENDNCFYGGYLKLRNRKTSAMNPQNWWVDCCEGIGIDIFPLDNGFENSVLEERKQKKIKLLQRLLYAKAYGYFPAFYDMKMLEWKAYKYIGKLFSRKQISDKLTEVLKQGDSNINAPLGIYTHYLGNKPPRFMDRQAFHKDCVMLYEDVPLHVPMGWEAVLKKLYGEKFMTPLPWTARKKRHGFYHTEIPYTVYKERFRGLFRPMPSTEKTIVLFGDGYLFEAYFERYADEKYKPNYIIALHNEYINQTVHGIKVGTMDDIVLLDKETIYPIICSIDIRSAELKLQQAGFVDYHIFMKVREWMLYANPTLILQELGEN